MDTKDKIWIATKAFEKGWSYEDIKYGDDLYEYDGNPEKDDIMDEIWDYVKEIKEKGTGWFKEEYKDFKLYF